MNTEREEIELIHREIKQINKKLDRVLLTLLGDEDMNIDGLVAKVAQHEKYIQKQKLFFAKMGGIATAMGVIGGLIVQLILKLIS
jgi:hypothetical protein